MKCEIKKCGSVMKSNETLQHMMKNIFRADTHWIYVSSGYTIVAPLKGCNDLVRNFMDEGVYPPKECILGDKSFFLFEGEPEYVPLCHSCRADEGLLSFLSSPSEF